MFSKVNIMDVRKIVLYLALALILVNLVLMDYSDLSWGNNKGHYIGILAMAFVAFARFYDLRKEKKGNQ